MGLNTSTLTTQEPKAPTVITFDTYIQKLVDNIPTSMIVDYYNSCSYCKESKVIHKSYNGIDSQHLNNCKEVQKMWVLFDDRQQAAFNNWSKHIQAIRGIHNNTPPVVQQYVPALASSPPPQYVAN